MKTKLPSELPFRSICLLLIVAALLFASSQAASALAANPKPAISAVLKVVAVASAAKASEAVGDVAQDYFKGTASPGESVYSVRFDFERASWSDWFSRPDVFLVLEREGGETLLVPDIEYGWDYGPMIYTFKCPTLQSGSKCVLRLYDDDSTTNEAWKSILATRATWNASATAKPGSAIPTMGVVALEAKATINGQLQLYSDFQAKSLTINEPDPIATATFTVPESSPFTRWEMVGSFVQGSTSYGKVHLTHWYSNPLPTIASYLLRPKLLFWGVLCLGSIWALTTMSRRRRKARLSTPQKQSKPFTPAI